MLAEDQKIKTVIDNKVRSFSFKYAKDGCYICSNSMGNEIELDPDDCNVGSGKKNNGYIPLVVNESNVGIKYNDDIIYTSKHAREMAISRGLIEDKTQYANFVYKSLMTGKEHNKNDIARAFSLIKHGRESKYIVSEARNSVLVIAGSTIVTVYPISKSLEVNSK